MHPRRIETIQAAFDKFPDADMVLHRYKYLDLGSPESDLAKFRRERISRMKLETLDPAIVRKNLGPTNPFTSLMKKYPRFGIEIRLNSEEIRNFNIGAISIRKDVISQVQQPDVARSQDSAFLWEALYRGKTVLTIPAVLSAYTKPDSRSRRAVLAEMLDPSVFQTEQPTRGL
ncbi:MAG: uncharacterized protein KVP18_000873 [Porospora cf. gigantea A]|nr:MAG: hypothetical protein KVP18_000873 [Porospora cf. gigantea A]